MSLKRASTIRRQTSILVDNVVSDTKDETSEAKLHNTNVNHLSQKSEWEKNVDSPEYVALYTLFSQYETPDELRSKIYRELFNCQALEVCEVNRFQQRYPHQYDKRKTVYENYLTLVENHDCLSFC